MKPASLRDAVEWYRRQRAEIYRLAPREVVSNARGARATARDHMSRVIYELLQNAEDAGAVAVKIELDARGQILLFADDGTGLAPHAVESLAGLFLSSKSAGIGRKGVGFKAVYSVSDHPIVVSGEDAILFDRDRARQWMAEQGFDTGYVPYQWLPFHQDRADVERTCERLRSLRPYRTVVILPVRDGNALDGLSADLKAFDSRSLLSFRNIQRLNVEITDCAGYAVVVAGERGVSGPCELRDSRVSAPSRWQLEWREVQAPAEAITSLEEDERERAQRTKVMVGVEIGADGHPVEPATPPNLLVYYPTRHLAPSRLLTHADFVVTSDRTQISAPSNQPYNAWLAKCVTEATVALCNDFVERGHDLFALRALAADARRKDPQELALREAVLNTARRGLRLHTLSGRRAVPLACRVVSGADTAAFVEIASLTALATTLPTADVLLDPTGVSCLRELGAPDLPLLDRLEAVAGMLNARPDAHAWVLSLWRWLRRAGESVSTDEATRWEDGVNALAFLPGTSAWVTPAEVGATPFLLGALQDPPDGVCSIHECHPIVLDSLNAAPDREELTEFLEQFAEVDIAQAQIKALDIATEAYWNEATGDRPDRFVGAIHARGLMRVPRQEGLLTKCPCRFEPVTSGHGPQRRRRISRKAKDRSMFGGSIVAIRRWHGSKFVG